jgi:undecaprenyl-diphosphatase
MTDFILQIDRGILLLINGMHTPWLDEVMWLISSKWVNFPVAIFLIYYLQKTNSWRRTGLLFLMVIFVVAISDTISTHLFKDVFQRLRPSHEPLLQAKLFFHIMPDFKPYLGGKYGFVSSHAANIFAALAFLWPNFKLDKSVASAFIIWGVLVCLSRVYLGVHYPTDIICGGLLGLLIGFSLRRYLFSKLLDRWAS